MRALLDQAWLIVRNDVRLQWRDLMASRAGDYLSISLLVVLLVIAHGVTIPLFLFAKPTVSLGAEMLAWFVFGFLILSAAVDHAVKALFERSDFDLLLTSPVSSRAILLARLASIAGWAGGSVALFLLPLLNGVIVGLSPRYVAGYPVWLMLAALMAAFGIWCTLLLVRLLGPQRARLWAQVVAGVLSALAFVLPQMGNALQMVGEDAIDRAVDFLGRPEIALFARAGRGEPLPLLGFLAVAALGLLLTARVLGRIFISGLQDSSALGARTPRAVASAPGAFTDGLFRATFWKEVRLIVRDPLLISQCLRASTGLIPLLFIGLRLGVMNLLGPAVVVLGAQFSMILTTVATSGEECWDLIRMSPTSEFRLRWAKMAAGMALPMAMAAVTSLVLAGLGRPGIAALGFFFSVLCASAGCWIQVSYIKPTSRRDIMKAQGGVEGQSMLVVFATVALLLLGGGGVLLASLGMWIGAGVTLGITLVVAIACFVLVRPEEISYRTFERPPV